MCKSALDNCNGLLFLEHGDNAFTKTPIFQTGEHEQLDMRREVFRPIVLCL